MFINPSKNFIYIRPLKVGSNSLMDFFQGGNKNNIILKSGLTLNKDYISINFVRNSQLHNLHYTAEDILVNFRIMNFEDYTKVISIRNPYSHAISWFLYNKVILKNLLKDPVEFFRKPKEFSRFIFSIETRQMFKFTLQNVYRPYTTWGKINGGNIIDDFIRIENMDSDLFKFCEKVGLTYQPIKRLNVNKAHNFDIYDHLFDQEIRDYIDKIYFDIFENFDYSYEGLFNDS